MAAAAMEGKWDLDAELEQEEETGVGDERLAEDVEFGLRATVKVGPCRFVVSLGEGRQSVRWLGLVASQRYTAFVQANGKQRQREDALLESGCFLPGAVSLDGRPLLPDMVIGDVLARRAKTKEGRRREPEFEVKLQQRVELGEDGAPVLQEWHARAFCFSQAGKERVEQLRTKRDLALRPSNNQDGEGSSAEDDTDHEDFLAEMIEGPKQPVQHLAPGFHTFFDGPASTASALEGDWARLWRAFAEPMATWFNTADYGKLDEEKEQRVKAAFLNAFEDLCQLLDNYGWVWSHKDSLSIHVPELRHLLHHSGAVTLPADEDKLAEALSIVPLARPRGAAAPTVARHEVLLVLLKVVADSTKPAQLATEVERICTEHISPAANALRSFEKGAVVRRVFTRSNISRIFRSKRRRDQANAKAIRFVFERYCIRAVSRGEPPTISLREFALFSTDIMSDAGMRGRGRAAGVGAESKESKESKDGIEAKADKTMANLRQSKVLFDSAQHIWLAEKASPLPEMVLAEFVHSLLLALYNREKEPDTWDSKYGAAQLLTVIDRFKDLAAEDDVL